MSLFTKIIYIYTPDVIGYISRVQPITDVSLHGKTTAKQIIEIKNIR